MWCRLGRRRTLLHGSCSSVASLRCFAHCNWVSFVPLAEAWGVSVMDGIVNGAVSPLTCGADL
eukprot:8090792-Prorocentrum_lima.AAC.1